MKARPIRNSLAVIAALWVATALAQQERASTVHVLSRDSDGAAYWIVDNTIRDAKFHCPFLHRVVANAGLGGPSLPALEAGRNYEARVYMTAEGTASLQHLQVNGSWAKVPLSMPYTCDHAPSPDGGHWEWVNNDTALLPGPPPASQMSAASTPAPAANTTWVRVDNQLGVELMVMMDGTTGCTAKPHRECTFAAAPGKHTFKAMAQGMETSTQTQDVLAGTTKVLKFWKQ